MFAALYISKVVSYVFKKKSNPERTIAKSYNIHMKFDQNYKSDKN